MQIQKGDRKHTQLCFSKINGLCGTQKFIKRNKIKEKKKTKNNAIVNCYSNKAEINAMKTKEKGLKSN